MKLLVKNSFITVLFLLINVHWGSTAQSLQENAPVPISSNNDAKAISLAPPSMNRGPLKMAPEHAKSRQSLNTNLFYAPECQMDLRRYCRTSVELNDAGVLQCIHNSVKSLNMLSNECQHLLYNTKKNLTINLNTNTIVTTLCQKDIERIPECLQEGGKHMSTCLLNNINNLTDGECLHFIRNMIPLVFTDYRLIEGFHEECQSSIDQFKCGRIDTDGTQPTQQGKTIMCLQQNYKSIVDDKCKKQILRVTELQGSDFHRDRPLFFACRQDRERFCADIQSGNGQVYKCLKMNKFKKEFSQECRDRLTGRQKISVENVNTDHAFYTACLKDIAENKCSEQLKNYGLSRLSMTGVMLCLENSQKAGKELNPTCIAELIDHRKMLMEDYQLSPNLVKYCSDEIRSFCNGGLERGGKTVHCLMGAARKQVNRKKFKAECFVELKSFLKVVNPAENVRIDPNLYEACHNLIESGPCASVQPGHGHMVDCLTKQLDSPKMKDECQERLLEIQFFVVRDWTLNPEFYETCKADAVKFCKVPDQWFVRTNDVDSKRVVLPCLYHHMDDDIGDEERGADSGDHVSKDCAIMVREVMLKRAKKIDLMPQVQEACDFYLVTFCSDVKTTKKGEELRCLEDHYGELEGDCKKEMSQVVKSQNSDIRLDQILYNSCLPTIEKYCDKERDEKGKLLECLIEQKNNQDMRYKCRIGIEHHQLLNMNDVSLNVKFMHRCESEIADHCASTKTKLDVVFCLSEMVLNDTLLSQSQRVKRRCREQLRFELLQINENINLDPELANSCQSDIEKFCSDVKSGKGEVIECLRSNEQKVEAQCRTKLFRREKIESIDERVDYGLQQSCKRAIEKFCHVDSTISIVDCLRKKLLERGLGQRCRKVVINRIVTQNKDIRLNPNLYKSCDGEISTHCQKSFAELSSASDPVHGQVLKCLKKQYVQGTLANQCANEVGELMREAANVDYRLDPSLAENCLVELEVFCKNEPEDSKENCLRLAFQHMRIEKNTRCFEEIKRIIVEGAADVFVDHELSQLCDQDLNRFCGDIPPGSSQHLKCLMDAQKEHSSRFSVRCSEALNSRRELWQLAQVSEEIQGLNDIAMLINNSHSRNYLFAVLFAICLTVFCCGMFFRSALNKEYRFQKLK